jgi:hypothetical protein
MQSEQRTQWHRLPGWKRKHLQRTAKLVEQSKLGWAHDAQGYCHESKFGSHIHEPGETFVQLIIRVDDEFTQNVTKLQTKVELR